MADIPDLSQTETAIVERTNVFRRSEGLAPVARNLALEVAAKEFAKYLAKSGRFAHEADGRQPAERAKAAGYWHCLIAENLALGLDSRGFTVQRLATDTVEGWKQSPGHRKNMLLQSVTEVGVGVAQAPGPDPKFISVQLLGRPGNLAVEFSIANKTADAVTYSFAGKMHELAPRVTATHTSCEIGKIKFERAGSFLTGSRIDAELDARDKAQFVVRTGAAGAVRIEVMR